MRSLHALRGLAVGGLATMLVVLSGCELIAKVDRSKIDAGAPAQEDASTDSGPPSVTDGSSDAPIDTSLPDGGEDATPPEDAGDATTEDASDGAVEDASDGATEDASDAASADASDAGCSDAGDCDDKDKCTADSCGSNGQCVHTPVPTDDGVACTVDSCDPSTGVSHTANDSACVAGANGNQCVVPTCDLVNGCVYPLKAIDDGIACTDDSCNTSTGQVTHTPNAGHCTAGTKCQTAACSATLGCQYTNVSVDDGVSCTDDSCDLSTGAIAHTPNASHCTGGNLCDTPTCDPKTDCQYPPKPIDDGISCTDDACNTSNGQITYTPNPAECAAGNKCQSPVCNDPGGCGLVPIAGIDDGVACTVDSCDGSTGNITHTPADSLCPAGNKCQIPVCVGTPGSGCSFNAVNPDDGVACTVDSCDPTTGVSNTPDDTKCAAGFHCDAVKDCQPTNIPSASISEFNAFGSAGNVGQFVEIVNTGATANLAGATLTDGNGNVVTIHPADDPDGSLGHALIVTSSQYVYGVANPASATQIPASAKFVYGSPGTAWTIDSAGPFLQLKNQLGTTLATVDAKTSFHSDPNTPIAAGEYPGLPGRSTQWDALLGAASSGGSWCTSWPAADTRGAPNGSCEAGVINEVLVHYATPAGGVSDTNSRFVELAGPGGGAIGGMELDYVDNAGALVKTVAVPAGTRIPVDGLFVVAEGTSGTTNVPGADLVDANAAPLAGGSTGASVVLNDGAKTLDAIGYGAAPAANVTEGTAMKDVMPSHVAISYARDDASDDTNDNATDFHFDPSPTPGSSNGTVSPAILSRDFTNALATVTTTVTLGVRDVADVTDVNGIAASPGTIAATFDGNADASCVLVSQAASYGTLTITCNATPNAGGAARGDLVVLSPAALALASATIANGWTYTAVANGTANEMNYCQTDAPLTVTVTTGNPTAALFGEVYQAGVTEAGQGAGMVAQVGYGPAGSDATSAAGWHFIGAAYAGQTGISNHNNQFTNSFTAPAPGSYAYLWRFSLDDGLTFTYCDASGNGSGTAFNPTDTGSMTVNP